MSQAILTALYGLDVKDDNHWTADGLPRLDTVKTLANDGTLTRDLVSAAAPGFTRAAFSAHLAKEAAQVPTQAAAPEVAPTPPEQPNVAAADTPPASTPESGGSDNAQEAQPPEVGGGAPSGADEVSALEAALEEANSEVNRLKGYESELKNEIAKAEAARNAIEVRLEALKPKDDNSAAIRNYLENQTRLRYERRGMKSPLDRAFQRPVGYGHGRPK
jgi:hypothetical protein